MKISMILVSLMLISNSTLAASSFHCMNSVSTIIFQKGKHNYSLKDYDFNSKQRLLAQVRKDFGDVAERYKFPITEDNLLTGELVDGRIYPILRFGFGNEAKYFVMSLDANEVTATLPNLKAIVPLSLCSSEKIGAYVKLSDQFGLVFGNGQYRKVYGPENGIQVVDDLIKFYREAIYLGEKEAILFEILKTNRDLFHTLVFHTSKLRKSLISIENIEIIRNSEETKFIFKTKEITIHFNDRFEATVLN